jgi:hypothetical protein
MNTILAILLLSVSAALLLYELRYFRRQKRVCQKYPFFKLRDDIIWAIVSEENGERYVSLYEKLNRLIERLKVLNFTFYSEVIASVLSKQLDEAYQNGFKLPSKQSKSEVPQFDEFTKRLVNLAVFTAKQNSLLLRLALTRLGYRLFVTAAITRALIRFLRTHPELFKKHEARVTQLQQFSYVGRLCAS